MVTEITSLRSGTVVVFEGIDNSGKTTQVGNLRASLGDSKTVYVHMPSGLSRFTTSAYALLSDPSTTPVAPLANQLVHLACHSESMRSLLTVISDRALVLDRWWWSTIAYGWYRHGEAELAVGEQTFRSLVDEIWNPIQADVVFLFLNAFVDDANNTDAVVAGYEAIATDAQSPIVVVPSMPESETHEFVMLELLRLGLLVRP